MKRPARYGAGEVAYSHSRNRYSTQRNQSFDKEIDKREEAPEKKIARRKAITAAQKESIEKEWSLRKALGSFSVGTQHYPQSFNAPAKLTKRGEESE